MAKKLQIKLGFFMENINLKTQRSIGNHTLYQQNVIVNIPTDKNMKAGPTRLSSSQHSASLLLRVLELKRKKIGT